MEGFDMPAISRAYNHELKYMKHYPCLVFHMEELWCLHPSDEPLVSNTLYTAKLNKIPVEEKTK